jgi:hypothetical protein
MAGVENLSASFKQSCDFEMSGTGGILRATRVTCETEQHGLNDRQSRETTRTQTRTSMSHISIAKIKQRADMRKTLRHRL